MRRRPAVALAFAAAAAFSAWNPPAAPFGLVVGIGAVVLAWRALGAGGGRRLAVAALVLGAGAALGSAAVLALTAGVGRGPGGADVVAPPAPGEVGKALDEGAGSTREARERARAELEAVEREGSGGGREAKPAR